MTPLALRQQPVFRLFSNPLFSVQPLLLARPQRSDYLVALGYWCLATMFTLPSYVAGYGWGRALPAMLYNVVLDTGTVFCLVFVLLPRLLRLERGPQLAATLGLAAGVVLLSGMLYGGGYGLLLHEPYVLTARSFINAVVSHARSYGLLGIVLIGKSYFDGQRRLLLAQKAQAEAQKAQAESELKSLRAQIDPHFLFNNLNILYALIQHNQQEASHFLSCFSSLYRYLIRHRDADFVPLEEELRFADEYIYLLRHRFGEAYAFHKVVYPPAADIAELGVLPGTLQVLIENVIKHNSGDEDCPLVTVIEIKADTLTVRNRVVPKRTAVESMGTGLHNLRERYKLLSGKEMLVYHHDFFEVILPTLRLQTTR